MKRLPGLKTIQHRVADVCGENIRLHREIERLLQAGDALYEATSDSWNAGYLEEATDARDRWRELRHRDGDDRPDG